MDDPTRRDAEADTSDPEVRQPEEQSDRPESPSPRLLPQQGEETLRGPSTLDLDEDIEDEPSAGISTRDDSPGQGSQKT